MAVADKALFRNCLVTMRPKTTKKDLPTTHDVSVFIHNRFADQLKLLKKEISVSMMLMVSKYDSQTLAESGRRCPEKFHSRLMVGQQITRRDRFLG